MSNITLSRIQGQIKKPVKAPAIVQLSSPPVSAQPVALDELKQILTQEINTEIPTEAPKVMDEQIKFSNLYDFVDWYEKNREKFSQAQQTALNTLVQTRDMISVGCNCKRPQREEAAFAYFRTFWENNVHTDMMDTLLKAANVKKLFIGNNFIIYPET